MPSPEVIRTQVKSFLQQQNTASFRCEDAFAPWFMVQHFRVPPQEAIARSSDGNYDGGIDGYHIQPRQDKPPLLSIIQAKFSDSDGIVRKGIDDLRRGLDMVAQILIVGPTEMADEHPVVRNLRRDLLALPEDARSKVEVSCTLIHLIRDQDLWLSRPTVQKARQDFIRGVGDGPFAGRVALLYYGPDQMPEGESVSDLAKPISLRFEGVSLGTPNENGDRALFGLGHLADLVELHEKYKSALFAKNVRMYLARQADKPKSAASHIEKSLEDICGGNMLALHFAMTHNGVTLSVPRGGEPASGHVTLEPGLDGVYVLNGCQTVYTAWKFYKRRLGKEPVGTWRDHWESIKLPMRIIVTKDDERVRTVTVGANRQTEIRPAAFWDHDPVQLDLERRFERQRVFYERQQGAWDEVSRSDTAKSEEFLCGMVGIESLARAIAAADRNLSMEFAKSPNRIFDEDTAYRKVFKEKNLASVRLLLFLVNTFEATEFVLRDLSKKVEKLSEMTPSRFRFPVFRLLIHWIAKRNPAFVEEFADARVGASPRSEIRERVRQWLNHNHSGIQQLLPEVWCDADGWGEAMDKERLTVAFHKLKLDNAVVFEGWNDFDEREDDPA